MKGRIYVWNNLKADWFSSAQRFFTRMPYTHSSYGIGQVLGLDSQLEAKEAVTVTPISLGAPQVEVRIFRINATPQVIEELTANAYFRSAGNVYGFAQVLWFVYRYLGETFGIDMRKKKNWFPNGDICSEVVYFILEDLARISDYAPLAETLSEWHSNTFHSGDVITMMERFPGTFIEEYR